MKIWEIYEWTLPNKTTYTFKVDSIWKDEDWECFYVLKILDWEKAWLYSVLMPYEIDSTIKLLKWKK